MRILILAFCSFQCLFASAQEDYVLSIEKHRTTTNIEFKDTIKSPLNKDSIASFTGLNYYPINEKYRVTSKFKLQIGEKFEMPTSSGKVKPFRQYGIVKFKLNGKRHKMPIYQNLSLLRHPLYRNYLFVPFTDLTCGDESYDGGRYIELNQIIDSKKLVLDFNLAFNPYCHYSSGYNCPIPPKKNSLNTRIEAGEKKLYLK